MLIDIPSDVAGENMVFEYPDAVNLPSYKPTYRGNAKQIRAACRLLEEAVQPLLYVGGGVIASEATGELVALMDKMQILAVVTLMGKGGVPASHPLNLGPVGMHGAKYSNMAMTAADLIIAAGAASPTASPGASPSSPPMRRSCTSTSTLRDRGSRDADDAYRGRFEGRARRYAHWAAGEKDRRRVTVDLHCLAMGRSR